MILKLIWKESRENLWKAVILTVVALAVVFFHHARNDFSDDAGAWLLILSCIATLWVAASTAAAERSAGGLDVLLALPVRPLLLFVVKAGVGLITLLLPLLLALLAIHFEFREPTNQNSLDLCLTAIAISVPFYFAILSIAARARQESRAAMIGVLIFLASPARGLLVVLIQLDQRDVLWGLFVPNPLFVLFDGQAPDPTKLIPVQIFITLFWICVAAARFLRNASNTGTGTQEKQLPLTRTFLAPLPHPPLLWKEVREQFSVFAIAFWSAAGIAIIGALVQIVDLAHTGDKVSFLDIYGFMLQVMLIAGAVIPLLISIVLGVGAFAGDLDERLLHFWQAQPIPINRWFWTKYLVSAAGILLLLIVPLSIAAGGSTLFDFTDHGGGYGPHPATRLREQAWIAFVAVIVIFPFAHALSIFFASIIRRTMYATILAIVTLLVIVFAPWPTAITISNGRVYLGFNLAEMLTGSDQSSQTIFCTFVMSLLLASLLLLASRHLLSRNWRLA